MIEVTVTKLALRFAQAVKRIALKVLDLRDKRNIMAYNKRQARNEKELDAIPQLHEDVAERFLEKKRKLEEREAAHHDALYFIEGQLELQATRIEADYCHKNAEVQKAWSELKAL